MAAATGWWTPWLPGGTKPPFASAYKPTSMPGPAMSAFKPCILTGNLRQTSRRWLLSPPSLQAQRSPNREGTQA
jgi:hypothetical protein